MQLLQISWLCLSVEGDSKLKDESCDEEQTIDDTDGNVQAAILMAFLMYFRYFDADFHSHYYQQPKSQRLK